MAGRKTPDPGRLRLTGEIEAIPVYLLPHGESLRLMVSTETAGELLDMSAESIRELILRGKLRAVGERYKRIAFQDLLRFAGILPDSAGSRTA